MIVGFDADVLIYAAQVAHTFGPRLTALLPEQMDGSAVGSVLLLPELLIKPTGERSDDERLRLEMMLTRLVLHPVDESTAELAVKLGAKYRLRAADAVHLATATVRAERFLTNNRGDFPKSIEEIEVVYPDDLPAVAG